MTGVRESDERGEGDGDRDGGGDGDGDGDSDDEGNCDDIGYANKIPPKAKTRSWKVKEEDGSIMVWYDPKEVQI